MKKRWLVNLILLAVVAGLVAFLYLRPKADAEQSTMHDLSSYKLAEFNAIRVEVPTQAAVTLAKVGGQRLIGFNCFFYPTYFCIGCF